MQNEAPPVAPVGQSPKLLFNFQHAEFDNLMHLENEEKAQAIPPASNTNFGPTPYQFGQPPENQEEPKVETIIRSDSKVGRNDLCPCGSGKKYKKCCGE